MTFSPLESSRLFEVLYNVLGWALILNISTSVSYLGLPYHLSRLIFSFFPRLRNLDYFILIPLLSHVIHFFGYPEVLFRFFYLIVFAREIFYHKQFCTCHKKFCNLNLNSQPLASNSHFVVLNKVLFAWHITNSYFCLGCLGIWRIP